MQIEAPASVRRIADTFPSRERGATMFWVEQQAKPRQIIAMLPKRLVIAIL
jgi:hypothetical protein